MGEEKEKKRKGEESAGNGMGEGWPARADGPGLSLLVFSLAR